MKKLTARQKKWIERTAGSNRGYRRILYNRFFSFILAVLLQLITFGYFLYALAYNSRWTIALETVLFVLQIVFILYILNEHEHPSSKINWMIFILLTPVFGIPMYVMNGRGRPAKHMKNRMLRAHVETNKIFDAVYGKTSVPEVENRQTGLSYYLAKHGGYPMFTSGDVQYYADGAAMFAEMKQALENAEKFILMEYFIIAHGKMWRETLSILLKKAMQGVQIRIIYDDFGSMLTVQPKYDRYLNSLHKNIRCIKFNKVVPFFSLRMNHRDHKKILIIDGKVGFTGGINLADEYIGEKQRFGHWKDSGVKITGESVRSLSKSFFYVWKAYGKDKTPMETFLPKYDHTETQEKTDVCIQPYDDSPLDGVSFGASVYSDIINRAEKYVWIFTPYLILDEHMRTALCLAAARGVDVRIVTPGIPDKKIVFRLTRANYTLLLKAGVRIYEYTPGFIDSKSMVSDDNSAVVGTINLDYRSLYHHFENAVYFTDKNAVADLKKDCEQTFGVCKERTLENMRRHLVGRLIDSVLRVFETMM